MKQDEGHDSHHHEETGKGVVLEVYSICRPIDELSYDLLSIFIIILGSPAAGYYSWSLVPRSI